MEEENKIIEEIKEVDSLEEARQLADRLEKLKGELNNQEKRNIKLNEELILRGRGRAGEVPREKTEEEKSKEVANQIGAVLGYKLYD